MKGRSWSAPAATSTPRSARRAARVEVLLEHPLAAGRWMARLYLDHAGLATSTVMKRRWSHNGRAATISSTRARARPADTGALSVTVVAQRTHGPGRDFRQVALILGVTAGLAWLAETDGRHRRAHLRPMGAL